eukprot:3248275-Pleurochrysis_carterae.AAC.1
MEGEAAGAYISALAVFAGDACAQSTLVGSCPCGKRGWWLWTWRLAATTPTSRGRKWRARYCRGCMRREVPIVAQVPQLRTRAQLSSVDPAPREWGGALSAQTQLPRRLKGSRRAGGAGSRIQLNGGESSWMVENAGARRGGRSLRTTRRC